MGVGAGEIPQVNAKVKVIKKKRRKKEEERHPCSRFFRRYHASETTKLPTIFQAVNKRQKLNQNKIRFSLSFFIGFNRLSVV